MAEQIKQPEQTVEADQKRRVHRSPVAPFISLEKAVERAKAVYAGAKKFPARASTAASWWGYGAKSSGGLQTIAALKQYGLVADEGTGTARQIQLTDLALRLVLANHPQERKSELQQAALSPKVHADLWARWHWNLPDDTVIRDYLLFEQKFNPASVADCIRVYRASLAFANLIGSDSLSESEADKPDEEERVGEGLAERSRGGPDHGERPPIVTDAEQFRVGPSTRVTVRFDGPVDRRAIQKLIKHYQDNMDIYPGGDE